LSFCIWYFCMCMIIWCMLVLVVLFFFQEVDGIRGQPLSRWIGDVNKGQDFCYCFSECKNVMPLFFYHCPVFYEFNAFKIIYEVKNNETH
ncbi:hypothetical protein ACISN2_04930, partial [Campylobacter jejuni]